MAHGSRTSSLLTALSGVLLAKMLICAPALAAVGRTSGTFDVSADGAATYSIPLWVPPGPRGVQPHLSLVYDSNAGNSSLGHGWALSGISSISRCVRTFAQDATPDPVDLSQNDGFCIGGKRLRLNGGTYGANGSTYQTEIADFSLVTANVPGSNGPASFTVQGLDGLTYEFGNGGNSQVLATGTGVATSWMLDKISDRLGNTLLTISYKALSSDLVGATVPDVISWAPSSSGASSFQNSVQFNYTTNSPQGSLYAYVANTAVQNSTLLTSVVVSGAGTVARKYALTYVASPTTGVNRLTQIQECADLAGSNCYSATTATYQNGAVGVSNTGTAITAIDFEASLDFNGDGFKDLVYRPPSGPWYVAWGSPSGFGTGVSTGVSGTSGLSIAFGDVTGSEKAGILAPNGSTWWYYTWNGASFAGVNTGAAYNASAQYAGLQDVNGDGLPDLISGTVAGPTNNKTYTILTRLNTSSAGSIAFTSGANTVFSSGLLGPFTSAELLIPKRASASDPQIDFDGDGRGDLVLSTHEIPSFGCLPGHPCTAKPYNYPLLSRPSGYTRGLAIPIALKPAFILDWNSDSCSDSALNGPISGGVFTATCDGSSGGPAISTTNTMVGTLDWDGDGHADLLVVNGSTIGVQLSTGNGIGTLVGTSIPTCTTAQAIDANGDGLQDLACLTGSTLTIYLHNGGGVLPDLATSITDGFGVSVSPFFKPLNQATYTPDSASYPNASYRGSAYVVDHYTATDGSGSAATYQMNLAYVGAWKNLQGRGFLGFDSIRTIDTRPSGLVSVISYMRGYPWTGMIAEDDLFQSDGTTYIRATTFNQAASGVVLSAVPYSERYFPHYDKEVTNSYEVGGARNAARMVFEEKLYTYDLWGNQTQIVTTTTDKDFASFQLNKSWSETITRTISPDVGNWCLDKPTQEQRTRTTPDLGGSTVTRTVNYSVNYALCRPYQQVVEPSSPTYSVTTDWLYDAFGNRSNVTITGAGMAARTTLFGWGPTGQLLKSVQNPLAQTTSYDYDYRFGVRTSETTPNSGANNTTWTSDAFGRVVQENRPDGTYTIRTLTAAGGGIDPRAVYTIANASYASGGAIVRTDYDYFDQFDRIIDSYHPAQIGSQYVVETRGYDAYGRKGWEGKPFLSAGISAYTPAFQETYTHDPLDRLTLVTRPTSDSSPTPVYTIITYAGAKRNVDDALGKNTTTFTNVVGLLARATDNDGNSQTLGYEPFGNIAGVTDSLGNTLFSASYQYGIGEFQTSSSEADLSSQISVTSSYDALGEQTGYTDAMGQSFSYSYDALSRPVLRVEPGLTTTWDWGAVAGDYNIGKLKKTYTSAGYVEEYSYDTASRRSESKVTIPLDQDYYIDYAYNASGTLDVLTYPTSTAATRIQLKYGYAQGQLASISDFTGGVAGTTYWQASDIGPWGQISKIALGNGVNTARVNDGVTGWMTSVRSGIGASTGLQNLSLLYDAVGNVAQRLETNLGLIETFYYDNLHRLEHSTLQTGAGSPVTNLALTYCPTVAHPTCLAGNVETKSDVNAGAAWTYDPVRKHAVTSTGAGGASYIYDNNGNMISHGGYSIYWTSYNYPSTIGTATEATDFAYGPDRQYYQQTYNGPGGSETTRYVGGLLEKVTVGSTVDWRHYVKVDDEAVAIVSRKSTGANSVAYPLDDHLGSPSMLTDGAGSAIVSESFDSFGLPRDGTAWSGPVSPTDQSSIAGISRRGYTGHSMVGKMGLIHMNGRVQNASLGRFLSADSYVPEIGDTQSYNRYSYVNNRPLTFTDPTGFDGEDVLDQVTVIGTRIVKNPDDGPGGGDTGNSACRKNDHGGLADPSACGKVKSNQKRYKTQDQAGIAAVCNSNVVSRQGNIEYSGFVYQNSDGTYSYTDAYPGTDTTSGPNAAMSDFKQVPTAWYHSHGKYEAALGRGNFRYSGDDMNFSDSTGKSNYMADPANDVHRYDPGTSSKRGSQKDYGSCDNQQK